MRGCGRWKNVEEMGNMREIYVEERSEVEKMDVELGYRENDVSTLKSH
jgi:hypothetical protein